MQLFLQTAADFPKVGRGSGDNRDPGGEFLPVFNTAHFLHFRFTAEPGKYLRQGDVVVQRVPALQHGVSSYHKGIRLILRQFPEHLHFPVFPVIIAVFRIELADNILIAFGVLHRTLMSS